MDFFNKIGSKISTGANAVASKTKDIAGTAKINMQIAEDEKELNNVFCELGKKYYNQSVSEVLPEYKDEFDKVKALQEKIEAAKKQLREIKGIVVCEKCGAEIDADAKFCSVCGAPAPAKVVVTTPEADTTKTVTCPVCGKVEPAGTKFCSVCGCNLT